MGQVSWVDSSNTLKSHHINLYIALDIFNLLFVVDKSIWRIDSVVEGFLWEVFRRNIDTCSVSIMRNWEDAFKWGNAYE